MLLRKMSPNIAPSQQSCADCAVYVHTPDATAKAARMSMANEEYAMRLRDTKLLEK